jgi:hypothetical protein
MRPKVRRLAVIVGTSAALGAGWSGTASAEPDGSAPAAASGPSAAPAAPSAAPAAPSAAPAASPDTASSPTGRPA